MAMKKAEMEAHAEGYRAQLHRHVTAESRGMYRAAVDAAMEAWGHIDGMMQYERKYQENECSENSKRSTSFSSTPRCCWMAAAWTGWKASSTSANG